MYLKKIFGNVNNAAINLSRRISPTSEVMKMTKILDPGYTVYIRTVSMLTHSLLEI